MRAIQSSELTRMCSSVPPSASASSASVAGRRRVASSSESSSSTSTSCGQGVRASDRLMYAAASNPSGGATAASFAIAARRIRSTRKVRRSSRPWSYAARYQRPEWTTRPCGLSARRVFSPENDR